MRWRIAGISAIQVKIFVILKAFLCYFNLKLLFGVQVMLQFWKFKLWNWKDVIERQGTWIDGVSYFDVGSDGLIHRHIADKVGIMIVYNLCPFTNFITLLHCL